MEIRTIDVKDVKLNPSYIFKPYAAKWKTQIILGKIHNGVRTIFNIPRVKYFDSAKLAKSFIENMRAKEFEREQ
jgi:hypothetical protein